MHEVWSLGPALCVSAGGSPILAEALVTLLGSPEPEAASPAREQLGLELVPNPPAGWMLLSNGVSILRIRSPRELAPALEGLLVGWATRTRERCLALHSACAAVAGKTVVLLGASGAGKSSLCLSLSLAGARHLGDEVVFVNADTGYVEPFPKAITLKRGSFHLIPECRSHVDPARGPIRYFRPKHSARMGEAKEPISLIVFPRFDQRCSETRITWLGPEETAFGLVGQCFGGMDRLSDSLATLAKLSERGSYAIEFSDASDVCRRIEQLVELP